MDNSLIHSKSEQFWGFELFGMNEVIKRRKEVMKVDEEKKTKIPLTGQEYLESLKDGREIWLHGEKVKDVTTHPAFRNAARSIARLYDALHDEKTKDVLTTETDTGNGGFTQKYFRVDKNLKNYWNPEMPLRSGQS